MTIVAVLGAPADTDGVVLRGLRGRADALEVRADLVGDVDPQWLRHQFPGTLIYSLRSAEEGGQFRGDTTERHARLRAAARAYDVIDLEWAHDLTPELLAAIPASRRRLSRHVDRPVELGALTALAERMVATPASLYVLSIPALVAEDAVPVISLLATAKRTDLTAFATGEAGLWTRLLAPRLGAPVVSGQISAGDQAGVPTLTQLHTDYGFPELAAVDYVCGIVGQRPNQSASPRLHNRAYRMLGLPAIYVPFATTDLGRFWRTLIPALDAAKLPLRGLTIVSPFKERVLELVDRPSTAAVRCGAANVVWREGPAWAAETTDSAVLAALTARGIAPDGHRTAVVGCGAAGRAVASALALAGAEVFLVNRSVDRGQFAGRLLALPFVPLAEFSPAGFTLLVHATPVTDRVPVPLAGLAEDATVLEMVYANVTTALVGEARARGLCTLDGWDVLAAEVAMQFELITGVMMPPGAASDRRVAFRAAEPSCAAPSMEQS